MIEQEYRNMKWDKDDFNLKDQIELLNIQEQMQEKPVENAQTIGFNSNALYDWIENNKR